MKRLKIFGFGLLFFVIISGVSAGRVSAFSLGFNPVTYIERFAGVLTTRAADIVNYLIMQKRYIFDHFTDPNAYPAINIPANLEKLLSTASDSPNRSNAVSGNPLPVTTSTIPKVNQILGQGEDSQILEFTNKEREAASLNTLIGNRVLDKIAGLRADDLFANQYFEHASPDGKSATDLAQKVGYEYSLIGENLALGNFGGDEGIVSAWMKSPGHRANILNGKYTELGVAVKTGVYKGAESTIAVQIFGLPLGNCPRPNPSSKALIDSSTASIKQMQAEAKVMYDNLNAIRNNPKLDVSYYNQKISEYNYFAKKVNDAVVALKGMIDLYNQQVAKYNSCIGS